MTALALVTGATGFIGSHLCRALLESGYRVRAFHRPTSPLAALEGLDVEHATGDILQPETLAAAMQGVSVVFHAAARLGSSSRAGKSHAATTQGTRNVLDAARQAGVQRLVHTSSVAALGIPGYSTGRRAALAPGPVDEAHTWNCSPADWPYGYAKYQAEMEVQNAVAGGLDAIIVNPCAVIGAGDLNQISGNVILQAAKGWLVVAPPGGLNIVYIGDVVRGHLAALERGQAGRRYILGGENLTHFALLQTIAGVAGVRPPRWIVPGGLLRGLATPAIAVERALALPISARSLRRAGYYFYYDTARMQNELGLEGLTPPRQAIAEAFDWYSRHGFIKNRKLN
jgi:dihydroflavonol-4-reductase